MSAPKSPQERLAEEIEQQHAQGATISDSSRSCTASGCGKPSTFVAARNLPKAGPIDAGDDYHETDLGLFIHRETE